MNRETFPTFLLIFLVGLSCKNHPLQVTLSLLWTTQEAFVDSVDQD